MAHGLHAQRRGRHEREEPRRLRQHLGRRLERGFDLAPGLAQMQVEAGRLRLEAVEQRPRVVAVPMVGRHAAGRRMRMGEEADVLELGQFVPHGGGRDPHARPCDQALRPHGHPRGHVLLDDPHEDLLLAL